MPGAIRLPAAGTLVARGAGVLVRLRVEHRVQNLLDLRGDEPVELGLELGLVDLYDSVIGHGSRLLSNRIFFLAIENRTQAGATPPSQSPKPNLRKLPDTTEVFAQNPGHYPKARTNTAGLSASWQNQQPKQQKPSKKTSAPPYSLAFLLRFHN